MRRAEFSRKQWAHLQTFLYRSFLSALQEFWPKTASFHGSLTPLPYKCFLLHWNMAFTPSLCCWLLYFDFGWSCIYKRLFCYENIHQASCLPFKAFWPALWDSPVISVIIFFIQPLGIFCSQFGILVVFLAQFKRVLTKLDVSNLNINVLWDLR